MPRAAASSGARGNAVRSIALGELARAAGGTVFGDAGMRVTGITHDSREVSAGFAFVAVPGERQDGRVFVPEAVRRGAAAVVAEGEPLTGEVPWVRVGHARRALGQVAAAFYGHPDREIRLIGITGTNGKTTTAWLLRAVLEASGRETGILGTVLHRFRDHEEKAERTTPEAPHLCRWLREMADAGAWGCVFEVSSHSLALERVAGLEFAAALFTNLGREHLDFHGTLDAYFAEKARLFTERLRGDGLAVVCWDDERGRDLARISRGRVLPYGASAQAEVRVAEVEMSLAGIRLRLEGLAPLEIRTPLLGRANVQNVTAAAAAALGLGVEPEVVRRALADPPQVPGRFERVPAPEGVAAPAVLVDYAHTDDALRLLLLSLRELRPRRLVLVFGCGGDRDREKRPLMGAVAARHADLVILTSDNPRSEDPVAIAEEIRRGMRMEPEGKVRVELDREKALALALEGAGPEDVVVAAGKGHEDYQEVRGVKHPHDDRKLLREMLARRRG
jgi:UDP-N-acetylmuramoyl-L-alanyl-D-glutamate--2,6-diaminopimelate ligase